MALRGMILFLYPSFSAPSHRAGVVRSDVTAMASQREIVFLTLVVVVVHSLQPMLSVNVCRERKRERETGYTSVSWTSNRLHTAFQHTAKQG